MGFTKFIGKTCESQLYFVEILKILLCKKKNAMETQIVSCLTGLLRFSSMCRAFPASSLQMLLTRCKSLLWRAPSDSCVQISALSRQRNVAPADVPLVSCADQSGRRLALLQQRHLPNELSITLRGLAKPKIKRRSISLCVCTQSLLFVKTSGPRGFTWKMVSCPSVATKIFPLLDLKQRV